MTSFNSFHIVFYLTAFFLSLTTFIFTLIQRRTDRLQNVLYFCLLGIVIINSTTEIINDLMFEYSAFTDIALFGYKLCQFLYFLFHTAMAPVFLIYEMSVTGALRKRTTKELNLIMTPFVITEFLVIINPWTHWVYYYDSEQVFHRGWGEYFIYMVAALYIIIAMFSLMVRWNAINRKKRFTLLYFFGVTVGGILIQAIFKNLKTELFAEALGIMGVMLSIESEDDRLEQMTGVYNRVALQQDLKNYDMTETKYTIISLRIKNIDSMTKKTGSLDDDNFNLKLTDFLKTLVQRYYIYDVNRGQYVIAVPTTDSTKDNLLNTTFRRFEPSLSCDTIRDRIVERFKEPWEIERTSLSLEAAVMVVKCPSEAADRNEVFDLLNNPIPRNITQDVFEGDDLKYIRRRSEVEKAIMRGVENKSFEVYYQPSYNLQTFKMHGAEALVRLNDKKLGFIPPDEFIKVAEQIGLVGDIDDFVLHDVCALIKDGILEIGEMDCINVNLSIVQFENDDFPQHLCNIVDEYGIDHSKICFEITETVESEDYRKLNEAIVFLKDKGFTFSMDDFGTGYSNVSSSLMLDFDQVKIDKSVLWEAEKSTLGMVVFENTIRMIRQTNRSIVVEGVETENQLNVLKKMNVDYLQGYYFSKPVPKQRFVTLVEISRQE